MRVVTWNLDHRLNGGHVRVDVITALTALEPDVVILTERLPDPARESFLTALAGIGLTHQLAPTPGAHRGHVLIVSRLKLVPGLLQADAARDPTPPDMLHVYAPTGVLDVLRMRNANSNSRPNARRASWDWLVRAARALKHRRAILIGNFDVDADDERAGDIDLLRHLTDAGWQHAAPADGACYRMPNGDAARLDHAFLSPSIRKIDARHALAAAGFRLAGTKESLSDQPVLVVDLQ